MKTEMVLNFIGCDNWDRPVYTSGETLFVDVDPRKNKNPEICTKTNNEFYGEPDTPIYAIKKYNSVVIKFVPNRITWE